MPHSPEIPFVSLNCLIDTPDRVPPQADRIGDIAASIATLPIVPKLVALYEIEGVSAKDNHGQKVASELGFAGCLWIPYGRPNEGMAIVSRDELSVRSVVLDPEVNSRVALIAECEDIVFAATHWSAEWRHPAWRRRQSRRLRTELENDEHVVLMGDLNDFRWKAARRRLKRADFKHNTKDIGRTFTSPEYPYQTLQPLEAKFVEAVGGFSLDGIYSRKVKVSNVRKFITKSDHYGLQAEAQIAA